MEHTIGDRRREPRIPAVAAQIAHATLRPGCAVQLVDLSPSGAQVQSRRPLWPGRRVHFRFAAGGGTMAVGALVLRCAVWAIDASHGVIYRGALRFDDGCPLFGGERVTDPVVGCRERP